MSAISSASLSSIDPSLSSTLPPINPALEPADIRNGNAQAKQAYQEALGFEDILVQQLTQELSSTVSSPSDSLGMDDSGDDSGDDSDSSSSGGILGSDPSTSTFASMIPQALTQSIMSNGGLGIAQELVQSIDPSLGSAQTNTSSAAAQTNTSSAAAQTNTSSAAGTSSSQTSTPPIGAQ
jgi:Rod binding domain-containing protein